MKKFTKVSSCLKKGLIFCGLLFSISANAQILINEDFSSGTGYTPPAGWTNVSNNISLNPWGFSNDCGTFSSTPVGSGSSGGGGFGGGFGSPQFDAGSTAMSGNVAMMNTYCSGDDANADLTSPVFDGSLGGTYYLEFDNSIRHYNAQLCEVDVWNGTAWINVFSVQGTNDGDLHATHKSINITTAIGGYSQTKVRFHYVGNNEFWWAIDNIKVARLACSLPSAGLSIVPDCDNSQYSVDVNIISMGSATSLTLTNGATNYSSPITTTGVYTAGPFTNASNQLIILVHNQDTLCSISGNVTYTCMVANNECNNAVSLTPSVAYSPTPATTQGSDGDATSNCTSWGNYGDVWFSFVANSVDSTTIRLTDIVSGSPNIIATTIGVSAYAGDCNTPGTELTCGAVEANNDGTYYYYGSSYPWQLNGLTIGHTYHLRVWQDLTLDQNFDEISSYSNFNIGLQSPATPLAINLKNIEAKNVGSANKINWSTAYEDLGDYFELERSGDGKTFQFLSKITANGKASDYAYNDNMPLINENYYRLKQINKEGKFIYSKTVKAILYNNATFDLEAYPNPVTKNVFVKVSGSENGNIFVSDISGKEVFQTTLIGTESNIDLSKMAAGVYFVRYTDGNFSKTIKIAKQ